MKSKTALYQYGKSAATRLDQWARGFVFGVFGHRLRPWIHLGTPGAPQVTKAAMALMVFGAMIFWLPMLADPYMTSRLLLVALEPAGLLMTRANGASHRSHRPMAAVAIISSGVRGRLAVRNHRIVPIRHGFAHRVRLLFLRGLRCGRSGKQSMTWPRMVSVASIPVSALASSSGSSMIPSSGPTCTMVYGYLPRKAGRYSWGR